MVFDELQRVKIGAGPVDDFYSGTTTNLYAEISFPSGYDSITISNDSGTDSVQFSYDGATLEGNLLPREDITVNVGQRGSIFIKGTVGSGDYRLWAW